MDKFYDDVMADAHAKMEVLAEKHVDHSCEGMIKAAARVYEHGTYRDGAEATALLSQYSWAHWEKRGHEYMKDMKDNGK